MTGPRALRCGGRPVLLTHWLKFILILVYCRLNRNMRLALVCRNTPVVEGMPKHGNRIQMRVEAALICEICPDCLVLRLWTEKNIKYMTSYSKYREYNASCKCTHWYLLFGLHKLILVPVPSIPLFFFLFGRFIQF